MLGTSGQEILDYGGEYIEEEDKKMVANITQFVCKVSDEHFTLVVNVID
jgi:predicted Zn-dependent protease